MGIEPDCLFLVRFCHRENDSVCKSNSLPYSCDHCCVATSAQSAVQVQHSRDILEIVLIVLGLLRLPLCHQEHIEHRVEPLQTINIAAVFTNLVKRRV